MSTTTLRKKLDRSNEAQLVSCFDKLDVANYRQVRQTVQVQLESQFLHETAIRCTELTCISR